ncbi:unnamed protein product [Diamesa tonsa]
MEQFKELKWSWYKYEDERKTDRTSFNFASIKDSDVFNRTVNEINKNLVPQDDSISLFKPKPSTSASSEQECKDEVHEYKDPRKCLTHILKCSQDIIKDFEYSSQLTAHEQKLIVASLMSSHEKNTHYYMENVKNIKVPLNISIKMEYQTKYGAETMSKDELLNEWCRQYFNPNSLTSRYRIDAKSLKILSITTLSIDDIELELKESHNVNPIDVFQNLFNLFNCIQRLPQGRYLIKCRNENSCKKLFLYKVSLDDGAKELDCHATIDVQDTFKRKFFPIH